MFMSRKRSLSEDGCSHGYGDSTHERKKARPVGLSIKTQSHFSFPGTFLPLAVHPLTPTDSTDGEDESDSPRASLRSNSVTDTNESNSASWPQSFVQPPRFPSVHPPSDNGADDDMMLDSPLPGHTFARPARNLFLAPPKPVHEAASISEGRVATPIYGHFVSVPRKIAYRPATIDAMVEESPLTTPASAFPPMSFDEDQQSMWWSRRRLPSPESEDEDDDMISPRDPKGGMMSFLRIDANSSRYDMSSLKSPATPSGLRHTMAFDEHVSGPASEAETTVTQFTSTNLPSFTVTESRQKQPQPAEKLGFSTGFRSDCDKCRMKVPGHYSHVIRS